MDIPDPLLPPLSIVHRFCQVFRTTSCIYTQMLYVGSSWSSCLYSAMWRGPQEYITYELVPTSPAVSRISGSSNFDSFRDGWYRWGVSEMVRSIYTCWSISSACDGVFPNQTKNFWSIYCLSYIARSSLHITEWPEKEI